MADTLCLVVGHVTDANKANEFTDADATCVAPGRLVIDPLNSFIELGGLSALGADHFETLTAFKQEVAKNSSSPPKKIALPFVNGQSRTLPSIPSSTK